MVQVPAESPVTTPVVEVTVAIRVLLLLYMPPDAESCNVVEEPTHTLKVPLSGDNVPEPVTVIV